MGKNFDVLIFRKQLIEYLAKGVGEFHNIDNIIGEYTHGSNNFKAGDNYPVEIRSSINRALLDLQKWDWIHVNPKNGVNPSYNTNQVTGLNEFMVVDEITAMLTMYGDAEYKKTLKEPFYKRSVFVFIVYPIITALIVYAMTNPMSCSKKAEPQKTVETPKT